MTIGDSGGTTHLVPTAAQRQQSAVRYAQRAVDENVVVVAISSAGPEVSELAAIDTRGQVLIDSLVQPSRWRRPNHQVVQMFASAPSFTDVMTILVTVVNGRTVVTYGEKTAEVIRGTAVRLGLDLQHFANPEAWRAMCLLRSEWLGRSGCYLPIGQAYDRPLTSCFNTLTLLHLIADDDDHTVGDAR